MLDSKAIDFDSIKFLFISYRSSPLWYKFINIWLISSKPSSCLGIFKILTSISNFVKSYFNFVTLQLIVFKSLFIIGIYQANTNYVFLNLKKNSHFVCEIFPEKALGLIIIFRDNNFNIVLIYMMICITYKLSKWTSHLFLDCSFDCRLADLNHIFVQLFYLCSKYLQVFRRACRD